MKKPSEEIDELLEIVETVRLDLLRLRNRFRAEESDDQAGESVIMDRETEPQTTPFIC